MFWLTYFLAIEVLRSELQNQVLANYEDLLSQATWVEKLEDVLSIMQTHVQVSRRIIKLM